MRNKNLQILFLGLFIHHAHANCLPDLAITNERHSFFSCERDSDCILYKDACRSCGKSLVAVNKNFESHLKNLDYKLRAENKCNLSCEACNTKQVKTKCFKNKCLVN